MSQHKVGSAASLLQNGQMKRLKLDETELLLARVDDKYYALGANCSHYGAPLEDGVLCGHLVMCPWHHACFDIRSAIRVEPPALNDLPHYNVSIKGDQVVIELPNDNEVEPQGSARPDETNVVVIVGGGAAGNAAAEELRRGGFGGKIIMLSAVPTTPVDRPNLSKEYLSGDAQPEWMPLRGDDWYKQRGIDLRLNSEVTGVDPAAHTVKLAGGASVHYDRLLLATGGEPRHVHDVEGSDLDGLFVLRSMADADKIIKAAQPGTNAVMLGSNFIAMEAAAALAAGRKVKVTVVAPGKVQTILGMEIGQMLQKLHADNGIKFRLSTKVERFIGKDGHVTGVELHGGEVLPVDFVVVGIGVRPATDYLKGSGISLDETDSSVLVDGHLKASVPDVFVAGDIARWDDGSERGKRIEHWRWAEQQGIVAARNILGADEDINQHVPFFWTQQWGITLRYVGHVEGWDQIIYRGTPQKHEFLAFYVKGGQMQAACGLAHDQDLDAIEFIMRDRKTLSIDDMRNQSFDLVRFAQTGQR